MLGLFGVSALSASLQHNPSLRTLPSPTRTTRVAAVVDPDGLDALLSSIDASVDAYAAAADDLPASTLDALRRDFDAHAEALVGLPALAETALVGCLT